MTRRERVQLAIQHQETDFIPYQINLTKQALSRLLDYTGDPDYVESIGNHFIAAGYGGYLKETKPGSEYWRDHFGVVWNRNGADKDIGMIEGSVLPEPTLDEYEFPDIEEPRLRKDFEQVLANSSDEFVIGAVNFSTFERAWTLRGIENFLADMVAEPEFVEELLDTICEHNLKVLDVMLSYPIDGIYLGDDWGQQKGLIMGPNHWRRFIKPRIARMYEKAKSSGRAVIQHSCGDINELFPDLIEIGMDVYQTFQPEIYDIRSVKREYGKDLTFWGGISTQQVLPWVGPDEVQRVACEIMEIMGPGGGYIAAPTHSVPADVPPENIVALAEVFKNQ